MENRPRVRERTLTMACPLAAEKALLNPEPMAFEQFDIIPERDITINAGIFDTEGDSSLVQAEKYFWDLRFFSIGILQDRNYSLDDRLIILGIIYQNIEKLFDNDKHDELPTTLEQMAILIDSDFFRNQLRKFTPNISIQIQMIEAMVYEKVLQGLPSHRYMECLEEILTEFGYQEEAGLDEIIAKCEENYRTYYRPYIMEKEYILENFLVNEFFKERMPFGQYKTIWDSYIYLCVLYSMIKLHLIGLAGYHQGLNDDLTLKLIQSLSKVVVHNVEYIQSVIDVIKENDYDSLAYMSKLIKN